MGEGAASCTGSGRAWRPCVCCIKLEAAAGAEAAPALAPALALIGRHAAAEAASGAGR